MSITYAGFWKNCHPDSDDILKNMERRLIELFDENDEDALKTTADKVEKTYAAVVAVKHFKKVAKNLKQNHETKSSHNLKQCFRVQGVTETTT